MSEKNKKGTNGKTINFEERKKSLINKSSEIGSQKNSPKDNRVIHYDIDKMREQINQQMKLKNKQNKEKTKLWIKLIYSLVIALFLILVVSKVYNYFLVDNSIPKKFVTENTTLDSEESIKYENQIDEKINELVKSESKINVITTSIHKNNNKIFAFGYFNYKNDKNKIYFDARLDNGNVTSVIVNGHELLEKK